MVYNEVIHHACGGTARPGPWYAPTNHNPPGGHYEQQRCSKNPMNLRKFLENQEKTIDTSLRANTPVDPRMRSVLPNKIKEDGKRLLAKLLRKRDTATAEQRVPANRVHAMRVPGYLCASDFHEHQLVKLTIAGVHYPGALITGGWREISFTEIPERVVCNPISKKSLREVYGDHWMGKQVFVLRTRTEIAGQPTYGLRMVPADEPPPPNS